MEAVTVSHSRGEYEVKFVENLGDLTCKAIITDDNVLRAIGQEFPDVPCLALPPGEATKSLECLGRTLSWLAQIGVRRGDAIGAIGGGVIGDLGGFVAATYMRGMRYVQVPTSLLAMVDSSVGGKVGIDLPEGKNLMGAFHPPVEVFVWFDALKSLPPEHYANGMAEVLKYGFINDPEILEWQSRTALPELIRRCISIKASIVARDEFETTGERAILNFGHTIGHAVEAASNYGILHGEAIAIGMLLEAELGELLGVTPTGTRRAVEKHLQAVSLPTRLPAFAPELLLTLMRSDKKATAKGVAFSLLTHIGGCKLVEGVSEASIMAVLNKQ